MTMASFRNSWIPLVATVAILALALLVIGNDYEHGRSGPAIYPGIYPKTERFIPSLSDSVLPIETRLVDAEPLILQRELDRRAGLEVVAWDEVLIALEDHHPITKSTAKAMAEDLTGYLASHGGAAATPADLGAPLVIILPPEEFPKLPMAVRRVLRVRTIAPAGPAFADHQRDQPIAIEVEVGLHDVLGQAVVERTGLAPVGSIQRRHVAVLAEVGATAAEAGWPEWHVSVGRAVASTALHGLFRGDPPEQPWDQVADRAQAVQQRHHAGLADGALDWTVTPSDPPHAGVERWYGLFQAPLVRGWGGAIIGTQAPVVKTGRIRDTIELLAEVMSKGKWQEPVRGEEQWLWRGNEEGTFDALVAEPYDWGWHLHAMQRHPLASRIAEGWLRAAETGDSAARHQVRRHLLASGLSSDWRAQAASLLRQDPDAAEQALLGQLEDASEAERQAAAAVAWIRGLAGAERPAAWPEGGLGDDWSGRPVLIGLEGGAAVVAKNAAGRTLLWWRRGDGPPRFGLDAAGLAEAGLRLPQDDG
jgi:hypothetical protein